MGNKVKGELVIIGGAEDKEGNCTILKKVIELAGGNDASIVIMTAATEDPKEVGEEYTGIFNRLGVKDIKTINIDSREDANNNDYISSLEKSSCIFFTGGDQLRITTLLGGTLIGDAIHHVYKKGVVVAGTSAGASVMSSIMIVSGMDEKAPKKCTLKMAPGIGVIEEVIIDQHFAQRGRIGRLLCAVAQNPNSLGIGIDEDTAIVVNAHGKFDVIGSEAVTVIDGKKITHTNVSELKPDQNIAISDVLIHILPEGYSYDMCIRRPEIQGG